MGKHRVAIFGGAGDMGRAVAYDQALFGETKSVTVIDTNWDRLHAAMNRLPQLLSKEEAGKLIFKLEPSLINWKEFDVVISCAPHQANIELTKQALAHGVPFCDLGGCPDVVAEQEKLARGATSAVVPDCGVSPGLANILASHLGKYYLSKRVSVRCGGNPHPRPDPKENPLMYKLLYSPEGTASGYCGVVSVIRHGEILSMPSLANTHNFDDEFESALTSHNSRFVAEYLRSIGIEEYDYETLRYRGHFDALCKDIRRRDHTPEKLAAYFRSKPELVFDREKDQDRMTLVVQDAFYGMPCFRYDIFYDPVTRFTAMEQMTSWGISIVAHHMASGRGSPKGFATPEQFVDANWVINDQLQRRIDHFKYNKEPRT